MSPPEISLFKNMLDHASVYLEYGSGGSTKLVAHNPSVISITSVDSDPAYVENFVLDDDEVRASMKNGRLKFILVDIGITGKWGTPKDKSKIHLWPNYPLSPFLHGANPDLVLVDGRFRVSCALASIMHSPDTIVLIHDYTKRPEYHILERFVTITEKADTLVSCKRRQDFKHKEAHNLLMRYQYEPIDDPANCCKKLRVGLKRLAKALRIKE